MASSDVRITRPAGRLSWRALAGAETAGEAHAMLLAAVFAPLRDRGISDVAAEVDATNSASNALLRGIGAQRTGGSIELVRRTRH